MKKSIHRKLEFTPDDIKNALVEYLRARDQPAPDEKAATAFSWKLSENGAEFSWSEVY